MQMSESGPTAPTWQKGQSGLQDWLVVKGFFLKPILTLGKNIHDEPSVKAGFSN